MTRALPDDLWREFPQTAPEFEKWFATEEDYRAYWIKARWRARALALCQAAGARPVHLAGGRQR